MKRKWNKILLKLIVFGFFFLSLSFATINVSAESEIISGNYGTTITWILDSDGILTITGEGAMPDASNTGEIPWYEHREEIVSVVIEEGVTTIGDVAFQKCSNLETLSAPDGITYIGNYAFNGCTSLEKMDLPEKLRWIGEYAFSGCVSLKSVELPENLSTVLWSAFARCSSLETIRIPANITYIDVAVFNGCTNLVTIELPENIKLIDETAFYMCDSLSDVYYLGTEEQWTAISINKYNVCLTNANIHCNSSMPDSIGSAIELIKHPQDQLVYENEEVSFSIEAVGNSCTYQWQYANSGSADWKNCYLSGYDTPTLTTKAVVYRDGMSFRCVVEDIGKNQVISGAAKIMLNREPQTELEILVQPMDQTVEENAEVSFTVEAQGTGIKYQWQYADPGNEEWKNCYLSGYATPTLTTKAVSYREGMSFRCVIEDIGKNQVISDAVKIMLNREPQIELEILVQPMDQTVEENTEVSFTVKAQGMGIKYQWQYADPGSEEWKNCYLSGYDTPKLTTKAVNYREGMSFRCVIEDIGKNQVVSDAAKIMLNREPQAELEILTQPINQTVEENAEVSFTVETQGTGIKYQWQYADPGSEEWKNCYLSGYNTSTLSVKAVAYRNAMQFRCCLTDVGKNMVETDAVILTVINNVSE